MIMNFSQISTPQRHLIMDNKQLSEETKQCRRDNKMKIQTLESIKTLKEVREETKQHNKDRDLKIQTSELNMIKLQICLEGEKETLCESKRITFSLKGIGQSSKRKSKSLFAIRVKQS